MSAMGGKQTFTRYPLGFPLQASSWAAPSSNSRAIASLLTTSITNRQGNRRVRTQANVVKSAITHPAAANNVKTKSSELTDPFDHPF